MHSVINSKFSNAKNQYHFLHKEALAKSSLVQNNAGRETEEKERNHSILQFEIYFSSSNGNLEP